MRSRTRYRGWFVVSDDARATASDRLSRARGCDARRSRAVAVSVSRAAASALRHRAWLDRDQTWAVRPGRKLVDGRRSNDRRRRSSRAVRAVPRLQALVAARDHRLGDDTRPDRYADGVPSSQVAAAAGELSPRSRLGRPAGIEHPAAFEVGHANGWNLDLRVYFATQHPDQRLLERAQAELRRLRLPPRR
jgi:hypothetical protein